MARTVTAKAVIRDGVSEKYGSVRIATQSAQRCRGWVFLKGLSEGEGKNGIGGHSLGTLAPGWIRKVLAEQTQFGSLFVRDDFFPNTDGRHAATMSLRWFTPGHICWSRDAMRREVGTGALVGTPLTPARRNCRFCGGIEQDAAARCLPMMGLSLPSCHGRRTDPCGLWAVPRDRDPIGHSSLESISTGMKRRSRKIHKKNMI